MQDKRSTSAGTPVPPVPAAPPPADEVGRAECRASRAPQHERGRRRVCAILDAASALLLEGGLTALSVEAVAKRSQTSKSSMYHFFPDRDAIIRALAERHVATISDYEGLRTSDAAEWTRLSPEEVVDRYLEPFAHYVAEHPDVLPCMQAAAALSEGASTAAVLDAIALRRAQVVIRARLPHATPAESRARGVMLYAVTVGTMEVMSRLNGGRPLRASAMRELRQVLIAYLGRLERGAAAL
ncbi:MAG TPA: TetR/AcrR family transcriptional regulator [Gemmatirosa sp.]